MATYEVDREKFYSMAELAQLYGVSVWTVRRRISDGTIPAVRLGRQIRVPAAAVDAIGTPIPNAKAA